MSDEKKTEITDNPNFNKWLEENYSVEIEEYEFPSSDVLYQMRYESYLEALERYARDPKIELSRIEEKFPSPIAYYFYQAENNYQNDHHRLDLLKSCWESIVFVLFGLVVGEARHRELPLKELGIKWKTYLSDRLFDKLTIIENIVDYATKSGIAFYCARIVSIETLTLIKRLNQERNGFAHASARTAAQQKALYVDLYPQLETVLKQLIKLEDVTLFRYHEAETPLYPRCEVFKGASMDGCKEIVAIRKENYVVVLDYFDQRSIFAKISNEVFCVAPFIHYFQEAHEPNALLCFYKKKVSGKYLYEVSGKSQNKEFDIDQFQLMEVQLKSLAS
ncbi:MAG: hypothetical protein ABIG69_10465 [Bacteroidota bacterium]